MRIKARFGIIPCLFCCLLLAAAATRVQATSPEILERLLEGVELHELGNYDGAIEIYHQILEVHPNDPDTLYELTLSTYGKGDYPGVVSLAERILGEHLDDRSGIYVLLGSAHGLLGDWAKGEEILRNGLSMWPDDGALRFNLGISLAGQKKFDEAADEFETCVRLTPYVAGAWRALGGTLDSAGFRGRAFAAYARSLTIEADGEPAEEVAKRIWELLFDGVEPGKPAPSGSGTIRIAIKIPRHADGTIQAAGTTESMGMSLVAVTRYDDEWKGKSDARFFAHAVDEVLRLLSALNRKGTADAFWGPFVFSYFDQVRAEGHMEALAYHIRLSTGDLDVLRWQLGHRDQVGAYRDWTDRWVVNPSAVGPAGEGTLR